jgi:4-nitrophenyl phosphatase
MRLPRLVVFDLDGTIYRGAEALPFAAELVSWLDESGVAVRYFTNNSAVLPQAGAAKLTAMGIHCLPTMFYGTGPEALEECQARGLNRVAVVGEPPLRALFESADMLASFEEAEALVSGICRTVDYAMLDRALQVLLREGPWIATNGDTTYPLEGGRLQPGAGAILAFLSAASGRQPDEVLGKPSPRILRSIAREAGVALADCLMVGDREDTDIEAARRAPCPSWMVLTGITPTLPPGQPGGGDLGALLRGLIAG